VHLGGTWWILVDLKGILEESWGGPWVDLGGTLMDVIMVDLGGSWQVLVDLR
jgi:hypothetical protein